MNVEEAIALLKQDERVAARKIAGGIRGGNATGLDDPDNEVFIPDIFGIYQRDSNWIASFEAVGMQNVIVKRSSQLDDVVYGVRDFFKLKWQIPDDDLTLQKALFYLHINGYAAEIASETDIRVSYIGGTLGDKYPFYFMLELTEADLKNSRYEFLLRWNTEKKVWNIIAVRYDRPLEAGDIGKLSDAVEVFKGIAGVG